MRLIQRIEKLEEKTMRRSSSCGVCKGIQSIKMVILNEEAEERITASFPCSNCGAPDMQVAILKAFTRNELIERYETQQQNQQA
jgi:hypothetical protein